MIFQVTCNICGASGLRTAPSLEVIEEFYRLKKVCGPGMHTYRTHALFNGQVSIALMPEPDLSGLPAPTVAY